MCYVNRSTWMVLEKSSPSWKEQGLVILYQKVVLMRQKAVYCKNHQKNLCFTPATMSLLCLQYCSSTLCVVLHAYNNAMKNFILPVQHLQPWLCNTRTKQRYRKGLFCVCAYQVLFFVCHRQIKTFFFTFTCLDCCYPSLSEASTGVVMHLY